METLQEKKPKNHITNTYIIIFFTEGQCHITEIF